MSSLEGDIRKRAAMHLAGCLPYIIEISFFEIVFTEACLKETSMLKISVLKIRFVKHRMLKVDSLKFVFIRLAQGNQTL